METRIGGLLESMVDRIKHRGDHLGMVSTSRAVLAQTCLEADQAEPIRSLDLPFQDSSNPDLRICYDGQIGNQNELAESLGIGSRSLQGKNAFC